MLRNFCFYFYIFSAWFELVIIKMFVFLIIIHIQYSSGSYRKLTIAIFNSRITAHCYYILLSEAHVCASPSLLQRELALCASLCTLSKHPPFKCILHGSCNIHRRAKQSSGFKWRQTHSNETHATLPNITSSFRATRPPPQLSAIFGNTPGMRLCAPNVVFE